MVTMLSTQKEPVLPKLFEFLILLKSHKVPLLILTVWMERTEEVEAPRIYVIGPQSHGV